MIRLAKSRADKDENIHIIWPEGASVVKSGEVCVAAWRGGFVSRGLRYLVEMNRFIERGELELGRGKEWRSSLLKRDGLRKRHEGKIGIREEVKVILKGN